MALTKEKLAEVMTTASAKFADAMNARTSKAFEAIVTDDSSSSAGYSPFLLGGIGAGRKWVGNRVYTKLRTYGVRFDFDKFEKTVEVESDELADNPAISGAKIGARLFESFELTDEKEALGVLKNNVAGFDLDPLFGVHEYVAEDGVTVTGSYNNDIEADVGSESATWYLGSKYSVVRVKRVGEEPRVILKGGSPDTSEYTFDTDNLAWGWRTRMLYRPGMPYYTVRSNKALTEETLQEALDLMATFINDANEGVSNAPTHIIVKRGTAAAVAAKKILNRALINGGEDNIYQGMLQILEVDHI